MAHDAFSKDGNEAVMFGISGAVHIRADDGESPACFAGWNDALDFCAELLASRRSCANCHRFLAYPLTGPGGWCNRLTIGVPTSPDFYCKAWEEKR